VVLEATVLWGDGAEVPAALVAVMEALRKKTEISGGFITAIEHELGEGGAHPASIYEAEASLRHAQHNPKHPETSSRTCLLSVYMALSTMG
jgi:hypothetical protein